MPGKSYTIQRAETWLLPIGPQSVRYHGQLRKWHVQPEDPYLGHSLLPRPCELRLGQALDRNRPVSVLKGGERGAAEPRLLTKLA